MPKVLCASAECKWNNNLNMCAAPEVHLNDLSIMTVWEGRQHLWRCKQFEMSTEAAEIAKMMERVFKRDREET